MKLRDYITGRVLAWLIIAALAGIFGIGKSRAADIPPCTPETPCSRTQAYNLAKANGQSATCSVPAAVNQGSTPQLIDNNRYGAKWHCYWEAENFYFDNTNANTWFFAPCPVNAPWDDNEHACVDPEQRCLAQSPIPVSINISVHPNLQTYCSDDGCTKSFASDGQPARIVTDGPNVGAWLDGTGTPTGGTCTPGDEDPGEEDGPEDCPAGEKQLPNGTCAKQGQCPTGMHEVEATGACTPDGACPTGQQKGPDGSCVAEQCPPGFAKKKNGTCGLDEDDDGEPDEEDEGNEDGNKASGGESCDAPPVCSGDPVLCLQTKIQWRIDCNTRKNATITGGACSAPPICTGEGCDPREHASLMLQWRATCALEEANDGSPGGEGGQPNWTKADGMNQNPGQGETAADRNFWAPSETIDGSDLDQSGWLGGGSCAGIVGGGGGNEFTSGFFSRLASPSPEWCNYVAMLKVIFILFTTTACIYILART